MGIYFLKGVKIEKEMEIIMKNKRNFLLTLLILSALLLCTGFLENSLSLRNGLSEKLIRLHVLANSNTLMDQALKFSVRDKILLEGKEIFRNASSRDDCRTLLLENIPHLEKIAEDEIKKRGFSYDVKISLGEYFFPMKTYGSFSLPAGNYNGVRVEIGKAKGENWWCVMYPPLCFTDSALSLNTLKESLTPSEMDLITTDEGFNIRFKIVDIFENSMNTIKTAIKK